MVVSKEVVLNEFTSITCVDMLFAEHTSRLVYPNSHIYAHTVELPNVKREIIQVCGRQNNQGCYPTGLSSEKHCDSFKIWISLRGKLVQGRFCYDRSAEPLYQHQKRQLNNQGFSAEYGTEVSAEVLCWLLVSQEYQRKARQRDREVTAWYWSIGITINRQIVPYTGR